MVGGGALVGGAVDLDPFEGVVGERGEGDEARREQADQQPQFGSDAQARE
jgi:hypothetical protein